MKSASKIGSSTSFSARLDDPVGHGGDGCFILLLLQSRVGMFGRLWGCVGRVGLWWNMMPDGTDIVGQVRRDCGVWFAAPRG